MNKYKLVIISLFIIFNTSSLSCTKNISNSYDKIPILDEITIDVIRSGYENKKFSVKDIVSGYLENIKTIDESGPELNSIITINPDALNIADSLDNILQLGIPMGPLFGIPVLLNP